MKKTKTALLVGVTGFIGYKLAHFLHQQGEKVVGTYVYKPKERLFDQDVQLVRCDVTKQRDVERLVQRFSPASIYYLAAQSSVHQSWLHPIETLQVNFLGGVYLFEALKRLRSKARVLVFSSGTIYGTSHSTGRPLSEEACLRPKDPYSVSKMSIDYFGKLYAQVIGLDIVIIRLANLTGPGQSTTFSIANFASQIAKMEAGYGSRILRVGNLSAKRDYLDIRDGIRAIHLAAKYGKRGEAYNIASGRTRSLNQVLKGLICFSSLKKNEIRIQREKAITPKDEIPAIRLSGSKFKRLTGWQPHISFRQTLADILDYWRQNVKRTDGKLKTNS